MRFALITDAHFGERTLFDGKLRKLADRAESLTREFVGSAQDFEAELLVNLGDVIEDESPAVDLERYRHFVQLLGRAGVPVLHVAGNHDRVHLQPQTLASLWGHTGTLTFAREHAGVRFLVLGGEYDAHCIRIPQAELDWLGAELDASQRPCVVLCHYPLADSDMRGNRWFERHPHRCLVSNRVEVRHVIERSGKVVAVFNGHAHWNHSSVSGGVPYVTLQSLVENLDDDAPGRAARAHALVELDERHLTIEVRGAEPTRYRFERLQG